MFFLKADGYINQKTGEVVHDLYTVDAPASHDLIITGRAILAATLYG